MSRPPVRLTHIISDLHTGGAQSMLFNVVSHLPRETFDLAVISLTGPGVIGERIASLGVPVYYLGMRRGVPNPIGLIRLIRLLRRIRPTILQSWLYHADLLGYLGGSLTGVPVLMWNVRQSSMDMKAYSPLSRLVLRALIMLSPRPAAVLVNSLAGQKSHSRLGYRPRRWAHVPNGFDLVRFRPDPQTRARVREELGLLPAAIVIGLLARFDPMKDHATFMRAALSLLRQFPDVHFLLTGPQIDWVNDALVEPIRAAGCEQSFHLLGKREDTPALLSALDLYTSSSAFGEGFSNSVGEAMACGIPCVVTDVGDSAWIVADTGLVVPPSDSAALANAWRQLLTLPDEHRLALGVAARQRMEREFDIHVSVRRYQDLYLEYAGGVVA